MPVDVPLEIPLTTRAPRIVRGAVDFLAPEIPVHVRDAVRLVVTELLANCLKHSGLSEGEEVDVVLRVAPERVRVEVQDRGVGFEPELPPQPERGSGWGLVLVDKLCDRWGVEPGTGATVWAEWGRRSA